MLQHPFLEMLAPDALKTNPRNARTHSKKQIRQIARSIERFGFTNPVLIDECNQIIAGHGRVAAARELGLSEVPTLRLSHLSEVDKRAYILADNRLAEKAGWDREVLALELGELLGPLQGEIDITGFEVRLIFSSRTSWTGPTRPMKHQPPQQAHLSPAQATSGGSSPID